MASPDQPLTSTRRIVTGHDEKARSVIRRDDLIHGKQTPHGPWIQLLWSSSALPPDVNSVDDLGRLDTGMSNDGTIIRIVDFPPKSKGLMHRSITLDYIFIIHGTIKLVLDKEDIQAQAGDAVIQQATMHSWDNETNEWTRLLCILIKSANPIVDGQALEQNIPFNV